MNRRGIPVPVLIALIFIGVLVSFKIFWPVTEREHVEAISTAILGFIISAMVHWYISAYGT